mgnify:CR=1 FL=1
MKDFDFGYFGTGDEGYAQYMTAFDRTFNSADHDSDLCEENFSDDSSDDTDEDL